ncbi:MAG: hypothetical protein ACRDVG_13250, partial [Jatrophihabitantaceae bacterium]
MSIPPDPDWYFAHLLDDAEPGGAPAVPPGPAQVWRSWWQAEHNRLTRDALGRIAVQQGFVLTRAQARAADGDAAVRRRLRRGTLVPIARGVLTPVDVTENADAHLVARRRHALAAAAATLSRPGQVASATSAAILHGLP